MASGPDPAGIWSQRSSYQLTCRVPEGEAAILRDCTAAELVAYAEYYIKGPWPEAEAKIRKDSKEWATYQKEVLKRTA